jgi:hypothetical protein
MSAAIIWEALTLVAALRGAEPPAAVELPLDRAPASAPGLGGQGLRTVH